MKRLDITVPKENEEAVEEVLAKYAEDVTSSEVEKEDEKYIQFQVSVESKNIDELTEEVKHLKDVDPGTLTVEILEQTARIEKGKQIERDSSDLSTQEMYSKALDFANFDRNSWILIALSAGIAELGVMMNNPMVVVGAMVIAPLLGPFISASFGLVIGDRRLIQESSVNATLGMLLAILVAFILPIPAVTRVTDIMALIATPAFITIPLSLFVGAAAALTFISGNKEQLAGVAVAIALVPPAAVAGLALNIGELTIFLNSLLVIVTNMASLILAGSLTFKFVGVSPSTYYRKKVSQEQLRQAIIISLTSIFIIGIVVGYLSYQNLVSTNQQMEVEQELEKIFGTNLLQHNVRVNEDSIHVDVTVVNPGMSRAELAERLRRTVDAEIDVRLLSVTGVSLDNQTLP